MHSKKFFLVSIALLLVLILPVAATGAKEKLIAEMKAEAQSAGETEYPSYGTVENDSLDSRFSYSYGYMITESLLNEGVSIDGRYWLKGLSDGLSYFDRTSLIPTSEMDGIVNDYIQNHYGKDEVTPVGEMITTEELSSLPAPGTLVEKFSYSYALMYTVQVFWMNGFRIVEGPFLQGAAEALYLNESHLMTLSEIDAAINEYSQVLQKEYEEYIAAVTEENLKAAEEYLEQNRNNEGVISLPSGDLMEIVSTDEVEGASPEEGDTVIVDYNLYLLDGTEIDGGKDVSFSLKSLIPGFTEACMNMKVGQEAWVYIHPDYGYGETGTSNIEPNSLLVFRIALKGIEKSGENV